MSVPERDVRLTPAARRDLRSIALYTRQIWGSDRQASYRAAIERVFGLLREHPQSGRPRDDLFRGCRSIPAERHVVYYDQPDDATIMVHRILHGRQDARAEVNDPRP